MYQRQEIMKLPLLVQTVVFYKKRFVLKKDPEIEASYQLRPDRTLCSAQSLDLDITIKIAMHSTATTGFTSTAKKVKSPWNLPGCNYRIGMYC
jgi:hypothetical protein